MKRILVIEDDPGLSELYEEIAKDLNCFIDAADTGEAGLALMERNQYALIFLDLKLPGYDGVEILQTIRLTFPETPVYVVTGFYEEYFDKLSDLNRKGISFEVLRKPFRVDEIGKVIQAALDGSPSIIGTQDFRSN